MHIQLTANASVRESSGIISMKNILTHWCQLSDNGKKPIGQYDWGERIVIVYSPDLDVTLCNQRQLVPNSTSLLTQLLLPYHHAKESILPGGQTAWVQVLFHSMSSKFAFSPSFQSVISIPLLASMYVSGSSKPPSLDWKSLQALFLLFRTSSSEVGPLQSLLDCLFGSCAFIMIRLESLKLTPPVSFWRHAFARQIQHWSYMPICLIIDRGFANVIQL